MSLAALSCIGELRQAVTLTAIGEGPAHAIASLVSRVTALASLQAFVTHQKWILQVVPAQLRRSFFLLISTGIIATRSMTEATCLPIGLDICSTLIRITSPELFLFALRARAEIAPDVVAGDREAGKFLNKTLDSANRSFGFLLVLLALLFLLYRFFLSSGIMLREVLLKVNFAVITENALHLHLTLAFVQANVFLVLVDLLYGTFKPIKECVHIVLFEFPRLHRLRYPPLSLFTRVLFYVEAHRFLFLVGLLLKVPPVVS